MSIHVNPWQSATRHAISRQPWPLYRWALYQDRCITATPPDKAGCMALPCWAAGHWLLKIVLAVWQYIQEFIFNSCFLLKSRYFDLASTWLLKNVCARSSLSLNLNFQGKQHFLPTLIQEQVIQAAVIQCNARYPIFWQLARLSGSRVGTDLGRSNHGFSHHQRRPVTSGALMICPAPMLCASQKTV